MITVSRLHAEDFQDCMDLIDLVFSQAHRPHDFVASVPKTNRPEEGCMNHYYGLREDGKLSAAIMSWPMEATVAGHAMKVYGIGNVATLQRCKGRNFMGQTMAAVQKDMAAEGCDYCELGGLRQRYDHFGYEKSGVCYNIQLSLRNCQRGLGDAPDYRFEPLTAGNAEAVAFCRGLYEAGPVVNHRGDDVQWVRHLVSWGAKPWLVRDASGKPVGYLAYAEGYAAELCGISAEAEAGILYAWMAQGNAGSVELTVQPWQRELLRILEAVCESISLHNAHQFKIFHWDRVCAAFFDLKATYAPLLDGRFVLGIEGWGNLALEVKDGKPAVSKTDEPAELTLPALRAQRVLFCMDPAIVADLPAGKAALLGNWFPLPIAWHNRDCV